MRSTAGTACTATAFPGPATGRRRRSCIRRRATIARESSSSPRRPAASPPHRDDLRRTIKQRPARHVDAGVSSLLDRVRDRAGHRLRDVPEHARRNRAGLDRRRRPSPTRKTRAPCRTRSSRKWPDGVFNKWKLAQTQVVNPPSAAHAVRAARASCEAANLFLGRTTEKLECAGCHGHAGPGRRAQLRQPGRLQRGGLRRQSQRARRLGSTRAARRSQDRRRSGSRSPTTGATRSGRPI